MKGCSELAHHSNRLTRVPPDHTKAPIGTKLLSSARSSISRAYDSLGRNRTLVILCREKLLTLDSIQQINSPQLLCLRIVRLHLSVCQCYVAGERCDVDNSGACAKRALRHQDQRLSSIFAAFLSSDPASQATVHNIANAPSLFVQSFTDSWACGLTARRPTGDAFLLIVGERAAWERRASASKVRKQRNQKD